MNTRLLILLLVSMVAPAAYADKGTLLVLNKSDHTVSLIDLAMKSARATLPTGKFPHEVAVAPDGKIAVIANYGDQREPGSSLTVVDVAALRIAKTIDLGAYRRPHGIVWLNDGVAVSVEGSRALLVVDVAAGKVVQAVETGQEVSHMVAVAPNAKRAFVANIGSGSMTAIDLLTGKKLADVPTGAGAEGIDISKDEREVWVTNGRADTVSVVDAATLKVLQTIPCKQLPIRAKFTADGKRVVVSNARSGDLAVFDAATKKEVSRISMRLPADSAASGGADPVPVGVLVSSSLRYAYVANTNADIVSVVDLDAGKVVDRVKAGDEPDGLGYSAIELP